MKEYIAQFYNEGLAKIFCVKPINYLNKVIKNKTMNTFLSIVIKVLYTVLVIAFAVYVLFYKLNILK